MSLYVIRHGKTPLNVEDRYNCRIDEDINEIGIMQAKAKADEVKNLNLDIVFCSPMLRTRHTLECLDIPNVPVIFDDRLMEREGGELTGAKVDREKYRTIYYNYYNKVEIKGLEPLPELFKRVHSLLDEIKKQYANKNVLIVTHGGVGKAIYFYFNELPKDGMLADYYQKNSEIFKYEFTKK